MAVVGVREHETRTGLPLGMRRAIHARLWPESGALAPIPALDGLRAVAVLLVILFHAWATSPNYTQPGHSIEDYALNYGRTGVNLFFVLSGFLLFLPYARWLFGVQGKPSTRKFYLRRALRVGPAYWLALTLLVLTAPLSFRALGDAAIHVVFLQNIFKSTAFSINGVFWTMAVEVQFYVLLPLIAWIMARLGQRIGALPAALCVVTVLELVSLPHRVQIHYTNLLTWLAVFGAGIACSVLYTYVRHVRRIEKMPHIGGAAMMSGIVFALALALIPTLHHLSDKDVAFGWAYATILFGVLFGPPLLRRLLEWRPVRFIGLISYSLYLWHTVMLQLIQPRLSTIRPLQEHVLMALILDLLVAVPVAYVSYQLSERPFLAVRKRAHENSVVALHA